jgi:hypothetical protein
VRLQAGARSAPPNAPTALQRVKLFTSDLRSALWRGLVECRLTRHAGSGDVLRNGARLRPRNAPFFGKAFRCDYELPIWRCNASADARTPVPHTTAGCNGWYEFHHEPARGKTRGARGERTSGFYQKVCAFYAISKVQAPKMILRSVTVHGTPETRFCP